jgi:hypothetical protein
VRGVSYWSRLRSADGQAQWTNQHAELGDTIVLDDPQEEARLDGLGVLAPVGATRQDVEAEVAMKQQTYREARRQAPDTPGP